MLDRFQIGFFYDYNKYTIWENKPVLYFNKKLVLTPSSACMGDSSLLSRFLEFLLTNIALFTGFQLITDGFLVTVDQFLEF